MNGLKIMRTRCNISLSELADVLGMILIGFMNLPSCLKASMKKKEN